MYELGVPVKYTYRETGGRHCIYSSRRADMRDKSNLGGSAVALNRSEKINLVQMAMKRVNVVPYGENQIAFGTNNEKIILGESAVTICESYINIPDEKHTCHVGFSVLMSNAVKSDFYIEVDGNERSKIYKNYK